MPRPPDAREGFGVAPILYMLGLVGVGAGILFSSYSQSIKSNIAMTNSLGVESDLNASLTTLAASSVLGNDGMTLCPPKGADPGPACTDASVNVKMTDGANVTSSDPRLPVPLSGGFASITGTAAEVGIFTSGAGVKQVDPWGHYYIYCRWEHNPTSDPTSPAIQILSAGAGGTLSTACGATQAAAGNYAALMNQSNTINRASVWQAGTVNGTSGITYGAGEQLKADVNGNLFVPGMIVGSSSISAAGEVSGASAVFGPIAGTTGIFTNNLSATGTITGSSSIAAVGALSADSGAFTTGASGTLSAANGAFAIDSTGGITVGSSLFTVSGANGNTATSGSFAATGPVALGSTLSALGLTTIASTTPITAGSAQPLLTVGKKVANAWPFEVDQNGDLLSTGGASSLAGSFSGTLSGAFSGSVAASSITDSGTLAVTGVTNLTGQLNGSSAVFSGSVTATSFIGPIVLDGSGGTSVTGILPITHGGTGASDATTALANLGVTSGGYLNTALLKANLIPGADLTNNSVGTNQLSTTGGAGTWNTVIVGADGRVTSGSYTPISANTLNDGAGNTITAGTSLLFGISSSTQGNWTSTGLMIGTSTPPKDRLDVYGGEAIGTSYAGVTAAPTDGLIVVGSVGIGTSAPTSALQVNGTVTAGSFVGSGAGLTGIGSVGSGSSGQVAYFPANGAAVVGTSAINVSGGKVGIGTTIPGDALDIFATGSGTQWGLNVKAQDTAGTTATFNVNSLGATLIRTTTNAGAVATIQSADNSASRAILNLTGNGGATNTLFAASNGYVGIGTTSPNAKLDIGSAGSVLGTMRLEGSTSGYVQIQPSAAAGSWVMTLPVGVGTSGYVLQTDGAGVTSWALPSVGTGSLTGTVGVAQGGTGLTSETANVVYKGNGTAPLVASSLTDNGSTVATTESFTDTLSIGTTSADGLWLDNATAAATGAQQFSPRLHFTGQGWETGSGASQAVDFIQELQPTQSATSASTGNLTWSSSVNNSAYSPRMTLTSGGNVGIGTTSPGSRLQVNGNAAVGYATSTAAPSNGMVVSGQVGLGTASPNSLAALDVYSTTQGMLPPRLTNAQRTAIGTASLATGMMIYNTDAGELETYDGVTYGWEAVGAYASDAGGSNTQIQYNNGGMLAGTGGMTWDNVNQALTLATIANPAASALTITGGSAQTTSQPALNITQTWNNAATNFTGILENITNTASIGTSKLIDLQVAGSSKFNVTGSGYVGIGITSPLLSLDVMGVNGLPQASGTSEKGTLRQEAPSTNIVLDSGVTNSGAATAWLQATNKTDLSLTYPISINPNGGNVGIGTTAPQATLDVNGFAKLKLNASLPVACSAATQGSLALTHTARTCVCDATSTWSDVVSGSACSW